MRNSCGMGLMTAWTACILLGCSGATRERPDQPLEAAAFRYQQRLNEDGTIPHGALLRAKAHRDAMIGAAAGGPDDFAWTAIGPGNIGGRIRGICVDPTNPSVMYLGACSGGVWKTTNGGGSWAPLDDFLPSLAIGCLVMHPTNPSVLYAGTGEGFFETVEGTSNTAAVRGAGIFKSSDAGATWVQIPSTAGSEFYFVNRLAFRAGDPTVMLAATGSGLYRSADGGETWTLVSDGHCYDARFHPTNPARAVAAFHDAAPRYSTDGGATWTPAAGVTAHRVELAYAPSNPAIVYGAAANANVVRVYRSTDGGQTYTLQTTGSGISTYEAYNIALWVDPTNENSIVLGGVNLYRSTNGGATLTTAFTSVHADHHVIVSQPGFNGTTNRTIFFGHDGGISRAADYTSNTTTNLNNTLSITQFYGGAINAATGRVLGGAQDNGTMLYTGNPNAWQSVIGGDGGFCAQDPTNPNIWYGTTQYHGLRRSTNGGTTYSSISSGLSDAGGSNTNFIPYYMLDPNTPSRMLAAARRLWRANNASTGTPPTWTIIKPTIEPPPRPGSPAQEREDQAHMLPNSPWNISTIAVARGNSNIIWVGHNNGQVWRTSDGTAASPAWTRVDRSGVGLPGRWVSKIVVDPVDHARVLVAFMGWAGDNLWRTPDAGLTWSDVSGSGLSGLPECPLSALAQHRVHRDRLFAGTEVGLFVSRDAGATWRPATAGMAAVPIEELHWRDDDTLLAVTHGRGMYLGNVKPCCADYNDDAEIDFSDIEGFLASYAAQTLGSCAPGADLNNDGEIDFSDVEAFLALYNAGC